MLGQHHFLPTASRVLYSCDTRPGGLNFRPDIGVLSSSAPCSFSMDTKHFAPICVLVGLSSINIR